MSYYAPQGRNDRDRDGRDQRGGGGGGGGRYSRSMSPPRGGGDRDRYSSNGSGNGYYQNNGGSGGGRYDYDDRRGGGRDNEPRERRFDDRDRGGRDQQRGGYNDGGGYYSNGNSGRYDDNRGRSFQDNRSGSGGGGDYGYYGRGGGGGGGGRDRYDDGGRQGQGQYDSGRGGGGGGGGSGYYGNDRRGDDRRGSGYGGGGGYGRRDERPDENRGSYGPSNGSGGGYGRDNGNGNGHSRGGGGGGGYGGGGGGGSGGGYGGGGGSGGGYGGRGGGGMQQRTKTLDHATEASANIIVADVTNNFRFYHYGIDGSRGGGGAIDSRRRKAQLFQLGMFDKDQGILARNGMSPKEIDDFRRITFFEGSFCYTSRPIPFLDKTPYSLVGNRIEGCNAPNSDNGDTMTVTSIHAYKAPDNITGSAVKSSKDGIAVDLRCADYTAAFKTKEALLAHCKSTGHTPAMDLDDKDVKAATTEQFIGFCNVTLQRAMGERMARWGREYIDPKSWTEPTDRNGRSMGVRIFRAFACEFGIHSLESGKNTLSLTVDLRAKLIRTKSLLDSLCRDRDPHQARFDRRDIEDARRLYQGEVVICTYDKKCYSVIDLDFENSPASLPVENTGMNHAEYFKERKGIELKYPDVSPIIVVLGRNNKRIFLPAELVCANELDPMVKQKLPMIASFTPPDRHKAIEEMRKYLVPGAQKTKGVGGGLLPALGIVLANERVKVPVEVLPLPLLSAAGVKIPEAKRNMWAPIISRANYAVRHDGATELRVVVVHHDTLTNDVQQVYGKVRDLVNQHNSHYRFSQDPFMLLKGGSDDQHCRVVQNYFGGSGLPDNIFVLDLVKPPRRQALDTAYSVVKYLLTKNGYLSQFVNFNTHDHSRARDQKAARKSTTILQGVARQILSKCGARIWWVQLPREIPLPAVFIGVDVFHSPRKYSFEKGKKVAKPSVAAVIVQIVRSHEESENTHTEVYSQTFARERGNEMGLGQCMKQTVTNALRSFNVSPMSCIIWRDGVGDPAIKQVASEEIPSVREALRIAKPDGAIPLSYLVVQKRISTKFLSIDGTSALPQGSLVTQLQGPEYSTFYINGTAPPYSTPKPARFIIAQKDEELGASERTIADLSWALCHDYSNWTGAIKLPSPVQMAHKLAELAGLMDSSGEEIDAEKFAGKPHFL